MLEIGVVLGGLRCNLASKLDAKQPYLSRIPDVNWLGRKADQQPVAAQAGRQRICPVLFFESFTAQSRRQERTIEMLWKCLCKRISEALQGQTVNIYCIDMQWHQQEVLDSSALDKTDQQDHRKSRLFSGCWAREQE